MTKNNWLSYFRYMLVFVCYSFFSNKILMYWDKQMGMTYSPFPSMLWSMIIFIILGLLLGLETFLLETKKEGNWRVNLPKIILLGVPTLYFSLGIFIMYLPLSFIQQTLSYPLQFFLEGSTHFLSIFQVIFGYIIITSFAKVED
ncbi:MAG TPA: hypothetical protein VLM81_02410 [Peptostreptococcaceae bacterium]|nr:hypothetical protein [Peptostreptococcaceae bacterium]